MSDLTFTSADLPTVIEGADAWYGSRLQASEDWVRRITEAEAAEIYDAVDSVHGAGREMADVGPGDFPLPTLGRDLVGIREEILRGRGFVLFRGLPVADRPTRDVAMAFWGIGTHIGEAVSQNARGHLLGHVKDIGHDPDNPTHRLYATSARHRFHTDSCDVVGLCCLQPAKEGGLSSIASSVTVFNEMSRDRPDLARLLAEPLFVDRKGEVPEGKGPYYRMPVFNYHAGHLTTYYARDFLMGAQRHEGVPPVPHKQVEAMDRFEALAESPEIRLDMTLEPGDMQFVHNHQIVHSRTEYEDHPEPELKRHLLRLWLSARDGRELPPAFAERYGNIAVGSLRGGIVVPGSRLHAPLEAE